jgi:predicted unusual protein kinase regulating ubiquinone biosynthesis (AarF/ABC1/UbiB family)
MFLIDSIKNLYSGFYNIKCILQNMIRLNTITIEELDDVNSINTLKNNIMQTGCIGIKFTQWYISHSQSSNDTRSTKLCNIFDDIFDQCPYHNIEHTETIFMDAFGTTLDSQFDMTFFKPIASGSIGQVYHTRMKNTNLEVVLKVKHPNVDEDIKHYSPYFKFIKKLQSIRYIRNKLKLYFDIEDFIANVNLQADFRNEVANALRFKEYFTDNDMVIIPQVHMVSQNVIISKYEPGVEMTELTDYQRYKAILNLMLFMQQTILIDDFVHGDLHIKNWRFRNDAGKLKFIVYDCGICFSSGDIVLNRQLWRSFSEDNVVAFTEIINKMFIGEITAEIQINIDAFTEDLCEYFKNCKFDVTFVVAKLMKFLYDNDLTLNKICLNMMIILSIMEHVFKKHDILSFNGLDMPDSHEVLHQQRMELINYCNIYSCYTRLKEYIELIETDYRAKSHTFELFGSIGASNLTFTPIE